MLCPYCRQEMAEGYLQSARTMFFTPEIKELFISPGKADTTISKNNWTTPNAKAWHCKQCRKIITEY